MSYLSKVGPKSNVTNVLIRRHPCENRENTVNMEAEVEVEMLLQTKECLGQEMLRAWLCQHLDFGLLAF